MLVRDQQFKAFPVSKINSETSFLYQLFNENSNFIVKKSCKVICLIFMMSLFFLFIYTYKAFPVSKINSETSFLYQLFKEDSNFIVKKPCKVVYLSIFFIIHLLFMNKCMYACTYIHTYIHSRCNANPFSSGLSSPEFRSFYSSPLVRLVFCK